MLTATIDGQPYNVALERITGLDAGAYRLQTGEILDVRIASLLSTAEALDQAFDDAADEHWPVEDRGLIRWLWGRQNLAEPELVADVLRSVTLFPAPDGAGSTGAPGVD